MKHNTVTFFIVCSLSLITHSILCATIGSDSFVTKFSTLQLLGDQDRVACFAALNGGFRIKNTTSKVIFDSIFPISGPISLAQGTLELSQDIICNDETAITYFGNIIGNSNVFSFPATHQYIKPLIEPELLLASSFPYELLSIDWHPSGIMYAVTLAYNTYAYTIIYAPPTILQAYTYKIATPYTATFHPTHDYIAASNSIPEVGIYQYISGNYSLQLKNSVPKHAYALSWHPSGDYLAIGKKGQEAESEIEIYEFNKETGLLNPTAIANINLNPTRDVSPQSIDWDASGNYLAVGTTESTSKEFLIYQFNQQAQTLTLNTENNFTTDVNAISWNKTYTQYIAVGLNGSDSQLRILEHNCTDGTIVEIDTKDTYAVLSLDWNPDGTTLAVGKSYNANSAKSELEFYSFCSLLKELTLIQGFEYTKDISSLKFNNNNTYFAATAKLEGINFYRPPDSIDYDYIRMFTLDNITLELHADITIKNCQLNFSGNSCISGNGNNITLYLPSKLTVDTNSNLFLKNVTIKGLRKNNICGLDTTSTFSLQNVSFVLDENFSFTQGTIGIIDTTEINGQGNTFSYQSNSKTYIYKNSSLFLQDNTTFCYDPISKSKTLLTLVSNTSKIIINGATFYTTEGITLTKGILQIENNSLIKNDGTIDEQAIQFGDGINKTNNLAIQIAPAATLHIESGKIIYDNV